MTSHQSRIVVGTDGSPTATEAVHYAANIALRRGVPLTVISSFTIPVGLYAEGVIPPQALRTELETEASHHLSPLTTLGQDYPGLVVSLEVHEGPAPTVLIDESAHASLLVVGNRGLTGIKSMMMGSTSASISSGAHCPVLVYRGDLPRNNGPVVVGIDGSEISEQATRIAFEEASARETGLLAVMSWADPRIVVPTAGVNLSDEEWNSLETQQHALLSECLAGYLSEFPHVGVERVLSRKKPAKALADQAPGAQLVVVGSHGRGGFTAMMLGSTSRALVQTAACPVMVVRPHND